MNYYEFIRIKRRLVMGFVVWNPRAGRGITGADKIKISFTPYRKKNLQIRISVGGKIFDKLSIKDGDKICFFFEEENKNIFLLKKSLDNIGYKVRSHGHCFTILMTWDLFPIPEECYSSREFDYDFYEGGVRIYYEKKK
jgi:hypothetical protein